MRSVCGDPRRPEGGGSRARRMHRLCIERWIGEFMRQSSSFAVLSFFIVVAAGFGLAYGVFRAVDVGSVVLVCAAFVVAWIVATAIKIAAPWDRAVVLRLGRFRTLRGPGLFGIIPIIDTIPYWIDTRVITTSFKAEKT